MAESTNTDLASPIPDDVLRQVGKVTAEWTKLDYVLRIVCKRLERVTLSSVRGKEILDLPSHRKVVKAIKEALNSSSANNKEKILEAIDKIGTGRNENLYGKRNKIIHGLFYNTNDGSAFTIRVGEPADKPEAINPSDIDALVSDLCKTWEDLLKLVPGPSNGVDDRTTEVSVASSFTKSSL